MTLIDCVRTQTTMIKSEIERKKIVKGFKDELKKRKSLKKRNRKKEVECANIIERLEIHPIRFQKIKDRLKVGEPLKGEGFQTVVKALELAEKYLPLLESNQKLTTKKMVADITYYQGRGTNEFDADKNLREAGKIMGWSQEGRGKKTLWNAHMESELENKYLEMIGPNPTRETKLTSLVSIHESNPDLFASLNSVIRKLRKIGVKNVPDPSYEKKSP